jgi:predicted phosphoadenosine phosphosulfate sulfurtransferase
MPPEAITYHPQHVPRTETYQDFFPRLTSDGTQLVGTRVAESVQRLMTMADRKYKKGYNTFLPIYDWKDNDVWLYIKQNELNFPVEYMYMYQVGITRPRLRISQFFSIDTAPSLVRMGEYYPDLMDSIVKREPNAYMICLYYDTEMFRRERQKSKLKIKDETDYRSLCLELLKDIPRNFTRESTRKVARTYKSFVIRKGAMIQLQKHWKELYMALIGGDPKLRTYRGLITHVAAQYNNRENV